MSSHEYHQLLRTVRDFLKMEEATYGRFELPDVPDINNMKKSSALSASDFDETKDAESLNPGADPVNSKVVSENPDSASVHSEREVYDTEQVQTLGELRRLCMETDLLKTDLENTNLVFGTGNPEADLMLIGEAPGLQEDKQGEPFVGRAGQLLNKILAAISFQREDVYITNILKHRPPDNRDPLPEERRRSLPFLFRQIGLIRPKLILCLGRVSAQTLLDTRRPMKELRGTFHRFGNDIELLVTFHPAALLRNPAWKRDTWEDVQLLRRRYDELTGN